MSNLSDEQLFFANLRKISDGELAEPAQGKLKDLLAKDEYQELVAKYKASHGRLQNALEGQYLTEDQNLELRGLVQDMKELSAAEEDEIERLGFDYKMKKLVRNLVIYGVIGFIAYALVSQVLPEKKVTFNPLETLTYETLAFEEDLGEGESDRIDIATDSIGEVEEFLESYPNLGAKELSFKTPRSWDLRGASVIDYEVTKIAAIVLTQDIKGQTDEIVEEVEVVGDDGESRMKTVSKKTASKDILVLYSFQSESNIFPTKESEKLGGVEYFAYESDKLNMIMWAKGDVYNVVVGRLAPSDMAKATIK